MRALLLYRLDLADEGEEDGIHPVDPREPIIRATDLGVTRGDGVFETAVVRGGRPQALDAHLARLERSAQLLGLPAPRRERWARAVRRAAAEVSRPGVLRDGEIASIKFAMTRGDEIDPAGPTGWVLGFAGEDPEAVRARGVSAVVLDRGYRHDVMATAPWLMQGAKSLAYAVNQAALREARSRGADDVIFVSADGFVLEGPRSTLIALLDGTLVTPPPEHGVLPGRPRPTSSQDSPTCPPASVRWCGTIWSGRRRCGSAPARAAPCPCGSWTASRAAWTPLSPRG